MDERLASRSETGEPGVSEPDRRKYVDTTLRSRGMICPGSASSVLPRKAEGAGNAGCTNAPTALRAKGKDARRPTQVRRNHSGTPCAMALRLTPCSPRGVGLVSCGA